MSLAGRIILIAAIVPVAAAVRANRSTSLMHAAVWAAVAWSGWVVAATTGAGAASYAALALTGCTGVAVLGARRPGAGVWNFVVLGLLVVLLLPLAEAAALDTPLRPGAIRTAFLSVLLGTTVMNYLPTRLAPAGILVGVGCGWELSRIVNLGPAAEFVAAYVGLAPWVGWFELWLRPEAPSACDRLWHNFRDRYGLGWGQRVREQFNRAASNAGLGVTLGWTGLRAADGSRPSCGTGSAAYETLAALLKRFGVR